MRIYFDYEFPNWNKYIDRERSNKFAASSLKKKELEVVRYHTLGMKYEGDYPIKMTFIKYFKDKRQDLDNVRVKGLIDGLVKCGVIKNDNLNCITEIKIIPEFDKEKEGIEVVIESM